MCLIYGIGMLALAFLFNGFVPPNIQYLIIRWGGLLWLLGIANGQSEKDNKVGAVFYLVLAILFFIFLPKFHLR
jgi:hypothetical protein